MEKLQQAERIGAEIKRLRDARNLTQAELGKIVGLHRVTIARIEDGMTSNLATLDDVARKLGYRIIVGIEPVE